MQDESAVKFQAQWLSTESLLLAEPKPPLKEEYKLFQVVFKVLLGLGEKNLGLEANS